MQRSILIIQNSGTEGPGLLAEVLRDYHLDFSVIDLSRGDRLGDPAGALAVIVLGGPDSANDPTPLMRGELAFVQQVIASDIPYLGICLGLQVLVKAAGGTVFPATAKEIGFRDHHQNFFTVSLTEPGIGDPLFRGLSPLFRVFQLHGETVGLTPEMTLLGVGNGCVNQIVKVGDRAYGIQCHFELTPELLDTWIENDADLKRLNPIDLRQDFRDIQDEYRRVGRQLIDNFLAIAI